MVSLLRKLLLVPADTAESLVDRLKCLIVDVRHTAAFIQNDKIVDVHAVTFFHIALRLKINSAAKLRARIYAVKSLQAFHGFLVSLHYMEYTVWKNEEAYRNSPVPVVYIHSFRGNGEDVWREYHRLNDCPPMVLVSVNNPGTGLDDELSPWPAEGVWKGQSPYKGLAAEHLRWMMEECVPQMETQFGIRDILPVIAGYSLAGLFALWAAWSSGYFRRVASVSGSLWYPGFTDFIRDNAPKAGLKEGTGLEKAYFSLGDRESRTRHPLMSRVDACTAEVVERVRSYGIETTFEWNPGNHFDHPELRMARALAWLLR